MPLSEKQKRTIGNRRLLKLANEKLQLLPKKRFNYEVWVGRAWQGAQDLSCGTTACALGWAATMPYFRRLGLRLEEYHRAGAVRFGHVISVRSRSRSGMAVARDVFYLDSNDAVFLFSPRNDESRATPQYVAAKIRKWVKAHPA